MAAGVKTGGRQKGTPNKLTFQIRQVLTNALADEINELPSLLSQLEPAQKLDAICKLAKFVLPTMQSIEPTLAEKESFKDPDSAIAKIQSANRFDEMLTIDL